MTHEIFMHRCLELAKKGLGLTAPNPLVGAVIVYNQQIIGEGYHQAYGEPHAEVNAINSVKDKTLLPHSKIYVSLEPCSHFGKTPPCANLILDSKIPEVIICNKDPHEKVAGQGIKLLEDNGVKVTSGILEDKGNELNKRFFEFHKNRKPYVILKWAENQNGFMDKLRDSEDTGIKWITQPETKILTHTWRAQEQAILVGATTVINDNPKLDVRHAHGHHPLRIVIDPNARVNSSNSFWDVTSPTIVFSHTKRNLPAHIQTILLTDQGSISNQILETLYSMNILSLIVEGGASTLRHFIEEKLWNEARILTGINDWKDGLKAPQVTGNVIDEKKLGIDSLKIIYPK